MEVQEERYGGTGRSRLLSVSGIK